MDQSRARLSAGISGNLSQISFTFSVTPSMENLDGGSKQTAASGTASTALSFSPHCNTFQCFGNTFVAAENDKSEKDQHCHLPKQLSDGADEDVSLDCLRRPQDCRTGQQIQISKKTFKVES